MSENASDESTARGPARKSKRPASPDGEAAVLAKIAAMPEPFRAMGERVHAIIRAAAPSLTPRLWYGMPAYASQGKTICYFRSDRYFTFGFTEDAPIFDDDALMTPVAYSLKALTAAEESRIEELVKKVLR